METCAWRRVLKWPFSSLVQESTRRCTLGSATPPPTGLPALPLLEDEEEMEEDPPLFLYSFFLSLETCSDFFLMCARYFLISARQNNLALKA